MMNVGATRSDISVPVKEAPPTTEPSFCRRLLKKIGDVVCKILYAGITICLWRLSPTLFHIGFFAGIVRSEEMKQTVNKICEYWHRQNFAAKIVLGAGAILSHPITLVFAAVLVAGDISSRS